MNFLSSKNEVQLLNNLDVDPTSDVYANNDYLEPMNYAHSFKENEMPYGNSDSPPMISKSYILQPNIDYGNNYQRIFSLFYTMKFYDGSMEMLDKLGPNDVINGLTHEILQDSLRHHYNKSMEIFKEYREIVKNNGAFYIYECKEQGIDSNKLTEIEKKIDIIEKNLEKGIDGKNF